MITLLAVYATPINLRDVEVLYFQSGQKTASRRGDYHKQLKAMPLSKTTISQAVCKNKGWDGQQVIWQCEAPYLSSRYVLRDAVVSCEGWDGQDASFVVPGSCMLRYKIEYSDNAIYYANYAFSNLGDVYQPFVFALLFAFVVTVLAIICCCRCGCCRERIAVPVEEVYHAPPPPRVHRRYGWWNYEPPVRHVYVHDNSVPVVVHQRHTPTRRVYVEREDSSSDAHDNYKCYARTVVR